jgi:phosphoribosylaminoimidazole-succinocarboxamide synthase
MASRLKSALLKTDLPLPVRRGKVRDVYDLGDSLLLVATDRISAYDVVIPNGIPGKGRILTALSLFWFDRFDRQIENHLLTTDVAKFPSSLQPWIEELRGRVMLVCKCAVVPIECIARGYLDGSAWLEYSTTGSVCGIKLPAGLKRCQKLPTPIFTPATKATQGHDQNITFEEVTRRVGPGLADELRERTLRLYAQAAAYAEARGIIIADTKLEFGHRPDGRLILIDELLTPDSSRFWAADSYAPGREQESFDKQFVRDWLTQQHWDRRPPAPALSEQVIAGTLQRYLQAYERLVGSKLELA